MKSQPLSHCKKSWDFSPCQPWPQGLPAFCWQTELLTGFERDQGEALDLSEDGSLLQVFHSVYPKLSLPELARLWNLVKESPLWADQVSELFRLHSLRWNQELEKTVQLLIQLPMEFQTWCSDKQLGARDLAPLRALDLNLAEGLWTSLAQCQLSKSQGVQALEWSVDLLLMGKTWQEIQPQAGTSGQGWLAQLKTWRFPNTESVDESKKAKTARLPWPARTQGQWLRQGDRGLLEVRLQADSLEDFRKKLSGLAKVEKALAGEDLLWEK